MSHVRRIRTWLTLAVGLALLRNTVIDWYRVTGQSMSPTLHHGQLLVCNRLAYGLQLPGLNGSLIQWSEPVPGEIVFFSSPLDGRLLVKRVAQGPGGQILPPNHIWVEGDNTAASCDSRQFGSISRQSIRGRATRWHLWGFERQDRSGNRLGLFK